MQNASGSFKQNNGIYGTLLSMVIGVIYACTEPPFVRGGAWYWLEG